MLETLRFNDVETANKIECLIFMIENKCFANYLAKNQVLLGTKEEVEMISNELDNLVDQISTRTFEFLHAVKRIIVDEYNNEEMKDWFFFENHDRYIQNKLIYIQNNLPLNDELFEVVKREHNLEEVLREFILDLRRA